MSEKPFGFAFVDNNNVISPADMRPIRILLRSLATSCNDDILHVPAMIL